MYYQVIVSVFVGAAVGAASFDCKMANNFAERVICQKEWASRYDEEISLLYKNGVVFNLKIKKEQVAWLSARNQCKDELCVRKMLEKQRVRLLDGADKFNHFSGEISGMQHNVVVGFDSDVLYLKFFSVDKNGVDCSFVVRRTAKGYMEGDGLSVKKGAVSAGGKLFLKLSPQSGNVCGVGAVLPKELLVFNNSIVPIY